MARALRIQLAGSFYHLTCRGNERKAIYRDDTDRQTFSQPNSKTPFGFIKSSSMPTC